MILLLGGTSHTAPIARRLAAAGHAVLVSKATDVPLAGLAAEGPINIRSGPLDDEGLRQLIVEHGIRAIVDATHPYAAEIRARAARVAAQLGLDYVSFVRPGCVDPQDPIVERAADHPAAARAAFDHDRPVLVTIGSRHLRPYIHQSWRTGVPCFVRVLDEPSSRAACLAAGVEEARILAGRGPWSVDVNRQQIRAHGIGVLVTKDSGIAGGTPEKLAAARAEGCRVIVVQRPPLPAGKTCTSIDEIVAALPS